MEWITLPGCVLGHGECLEGLRQMPAASCDSLVTDPPAGIGFMGKDWDKDKGGRNAWIAAMVPIARECLRVLKPGAHGVVWALPKTSHWTATAFEDAGFEIRDVVTHHFGTGFPKSKSLLKPATEHWILVRASGPLRELEIDTCRIGTSDTIAPFGSPRESVGGILNGTERPREQFEQNPAGRWPANLVLSHSDACVQFGTRKVKANGAIGAETSTAALPRANTVLGKDARLRGEWKPYGEDGTEEVAAWNCVAGCPVRELDEQSGELRPGNYPSKRRGIGFTENGGGENTGTEGEARATEAGGASRFFYCAKPSTKEREAGLELQIVAGALSTPQKRVNVHPTVKSIALMTWLIRLVTPPGGTVLDPFMGSGTTGAAALKNGFRFIGIEREAEYAPIARARIEYWSAQA